METLTDLIQVVNRKRISKIDVLDKTFLNAKSENLYYKLYHAIETKQVKTDEEASQLLYGTGRNDTRYKVLKSRLKEKVLNTVTMLHTDASFLNDHNKAYFLCMAHCHRIEIIVKINGTTKLAYELIKEYYQFALKYKLYDILVNYSYYIISYYSLSGNVKGLAAEEKKYNFYLETSQKIQRAKLIYFNSIVYFDNKNFVTDSSLNKLRLNLSELFRIKEEINIDEINFFYYYLALEFYFVTNDLNKILSICNEAIEIMSSRKDTFTYTRMSIMFISSLKAYLYQKEFAKGINLIDSNKYLVIPEISFNWVVIKEIKFKLFLQTYKIKEAYDIYNEVKTSKSFSRHFENHIEKWKIYHAYLVFLDNYLNKGDYKFSLSKFFNSVPLNTRDKSGFNFAIRIIEILFLTARKQYNKVFAQMESLRVYRSRYLSDITYKRNHLFLSLLLKSEKSGFDAKSMQNANWPEIQELRERKHFIAEWEIIPYEELWGIFVNLAMK